MTGRGAVAGHVAIVLHAHLPYVRHPEHERSLEERWLHEALWETYLPLLDMLDRLENEGIRAPFSLDVSPTLAAMWADPLLAARSREHVRRTRAIAAHALAGPLGRGAFAAALRHHEGLLVRAEGTLSRHGGDVLGGFVRHHHGGRVQMMTTAATHAFLPALAPSPEWVRAQIAIGRAAFEQRTGFASRGLWLPECAFARGIEEALAAEGVELAVLDAHGIALAEPRPAVVTIGSAEGGGAVAGERAWSEGARGEAGLHAAPGSALGGPFVVPVGPLRSGAGVTYFGRDQWAGRAVWAMDGYPSHPAYRELHRDLGFDAREEDLLGEVGPNGTRVATGLKLHRITGPGADKEPYDPRAARAQAARHAAAFVEDRARLFAALAGRAGAGGHPGAHDRAGAHDPSRARGGSGGAPPISVVPFDAELFGHFWHEGPVFLEEVLRRFSAGAQGGGVGAISLAERASGWPAEERGEPAASTWGEGGFAATWTGPSTAALWRHVHHAGAAVRGAVRGAGDARGVRGDALDQAIVEVLLLQSSDFAFMIHRGTTAEYARARVAEHARNAVRLAAIAVGEETGAGDRDFVRAARERAPFLREVSSEVLRARLR